MHGRSLLAYFGVNITREGSGCGSCSGVLYPRQRALRSTSQPPVFGTALVGLRVLAQKPQPYFTTPIRKKCLLPLSTAISTEVLSAKGEYKQRVAYSVFQYFNDFHLTPALCHGPGFQLHRHIALYQAQYGRV